MSTYQCHCKHCGSPFESHFHRDDSCKNCSYYRNAFSGESYYGERRPRLPSSKVHGKYKLRVTYSMRMEDHDGYCSDPYDEEVKFYIMTRTLQLVKEFEDPQLGLVPLDHPLLKRYYSHGKRAHGNGYCHRDTSYRIIRAEIIDAREKDKNSKRLIKTIPLTCETELAYSDQEWELPEDNGEGWSENEFISSESES